MKLIYGIKDRPKFGQTIIFAIQQLLAIMAATLVVPVIISTSDSIPPELLPEMSSAAALLGAGIGTLVYQLFTRFKSPVFLGSSFAFIGPMCAAFAGAASVQAGFLGLIIGATMAGLVYMLIALIVKLAGVQWIAKLMPAVVIGPTVAIIGLSLAGNAIGDLQKAPAGGSVYVAIICGLVTLAVTMLCATFGKKMVRLIPFIIGILAGYAVAAIFTVIGTVADIPSLLVINFDPIKNLFAPFTFESIISVPDLTFMQAIKYIYEYAAKKDKYAVFLGGNHGHIGIYGEGEGRETLLVIKDSFANSVIPYLAETYNLEVYDLRYFKGNIDKEVSEISPDKILLLYGIESVVTDASIKYLNK